MPDGDNDDLEPLDPTVDPTSAAPTAQSLWQSMSPGSDTSSSSWPPTTPHHRRKIAAMSGGIVVLMLTAGVIGYAISGTTRSSSSRTTTPTTIPGVSISPTVPVDPSVVALGQIVLHQTDVPATDSVQLIPNGNRLSQPTLDLCNGTFASETLRAARLQVASVDAQGTTILSTEAVFYRNTAATTQALAEIRTVAAQCPNTPVVSPVGEPTVTTRFNPPPDKTWPHTTNVVRLAYDVVSHDQHANSYHSIVVYLRRGRLLMGVYFSQPTATQAPVAGNTSIARIVKVFEARIAMLPSSVINS
jgi:hypothetical protein